MNNSYKTDEIRHSVWNKATPIDGLDPKMFRKDACGAIIAWDQFEKKSSFGWVMDHIYPLSKGGDDNLVNIRPMNYANDVSKGEDYPLYTSAVTMGTFDNVPSEKVFKVNELLQKQLTKIYNIQ